MPRLAVGRLAILALLVAAIAPSRAHAQDGEAEGGEAQATDPLPYEPDQRGAQEEAPEMPEPEQTVSAGADMEQGEALSSSDELSIELSLWLGASMTALDATGGGNLVRSTQEGSFGASLGFNAAVRIGPVAIGPRISMILDPSFVLANLGIGAQLMLLPDEIAPFLSASFGGTIVSALGDALPAQGEVGIYGIGAEIGGGVRWQATRQLLFGAEIAGGWHHLFRDAVPSCDGACSDGELDLRERGESDALTLRLSIFAGYAF